MRKLKNCAAPFEGLRAGLEGRHPAPAPPRTTSDIRQSPTTTMSKLTTSYGCHGRFMSFRNTRCHQISPGLSKRHFAKCRLTLLETLHSFMMLRDCQLFSSPCLGSSLWPEEFLTFLTLGVQRTCKERFFCLVSI